MSAPYNVEDLSDGFTLILVDSIDMIVLIDFCRRFVRRQ